MKIQPWLEFCPSTIPQNDPLIFVPGRVRIGFVTETLAENDSFVRKDCNNKYIKYN